MDLSLAELKQSFANEPPKPKYRALCENIFDVSRSDLISVVSSLRDVFWNENPDFSSIPPTTMADAATVKLPRTLRPMSPSHPPAFNDEYHGPSSPSPPPNSPLYDTQVASYFASPIGEASDRPRQTSVIPMDAQITSGSVPTTKPMPFHKWKWLLFHQLKAHIQDYREQELLQLWYANQQDRSKLEIEHVARYLLPIAEAMRRSTMVETFRKACPIE